jgi:hypothetical protein
MVTWNAPWLTTALPIFVGTVLNGQAGLYLLPAYP